MKNLLLIVGLIISTQTSFSQGFMGRRNAFEVTGLINLPYFSGSFQEDNFYRKGDEIVGKRDFIDFGAGAQYVFSINKKLSVGVEGILKRFEVFADREFDHHFYNPIAGGYTRTTEARLESTRIEAKSALISLINSPKGSSTGLGLMHEFGVGFSVSTIRDGGYYYSINEFSGDDSWTPADIYYLDSDWNNFKSVTLKYAVSMQIPITDLLHIKIGSKNLVNIYFNPDFTTIETPQIDLFNYEGHFFNLKRENFFTWNLYSGLVLSF